MIFMKLLLSGTGTETGKETGTGTGTAMGRGECIFGITSTF